MKRTEFKIREFHVVEERRNKYGGYDWVKLHTYNSLSDAIKCARFCKVLDPIYSYHVLGEFNYEEI